MNFETDELDLYDQYLTFIRRMIIDEYNLNIENPYDLDLEVAEMTMRGMKFVFNQKEGISLIYEAIDYYKWRQMKIRCDKLHQLGL